MSRATDLIYISAAYSARHCNEPSCGKCRDRSRWMRRKAWRARKNPSRSARNRKR